MENNPIQVHHIDEKLFADLGHLRNWQTTNFGVGQGVASHSHQFDAMYFTAGVERVVSDGTDIALPPHAAVYIPRGVDHSWRGVQNNQTNATVGHFHSGHGIHEIVRYD